MSKVRQIFWGGLPVFAVDHIDERGELREATFFDHGEAKRFAAEQDPPERPVASPAAVGRANRAFLARVCGRAAPKDAPRTLQGVLTRITGVMLTRGR